MKRPLRAFTVLAMLLCFWAGWRLHAVQTAYALMISPKDIVRAKINADDMASLAPIISLPTMPKIPQHKRPTLFAAQKTHHRATVLTAYNVQNDPAPPALPDDAHIMATRAYAALDAGDRRTAYTDFERALHAAPDHPNAALWRAESSRLTRRWELDAYSLIRGIGDTVSANARPLLGGGQSGLQIHFTPDPLSSAPFAAYGRTTIAQDWLDFDDASAQAALGVRWSPLGRTMPNIGVERLFAIGKNGRNAWAARIAGGTWKHIPHPLALDLSTYAEAGIIGMSRTDLYVGGQAYALHSIFARGATQISIGSGLWGGLQKTHFSAPSRVDLGPSLQIMHGRGKGRLEARLEYRQKLLGKALPRSGAALTLVTAF